MATRQTSRIPQTLANLHELYSGCADLAGVDVDYGLPGQGPARRAVCITGNVPDVAQEYAAQGNSARDEAFQVEVLVYVYEPGQSQQESLEAAFAILGVLELQVHRPNLTLARAPGEQGPVLYSRINPTRVETGQAPEGYETEIRCLVDCVARL
jgi:hypothetical protein